MKITWRWPFAAVCLALLTATAWIVARASVGPSVAADRSRPAADVERRAERAPRSGTTAAHALLSGRVLELDGTPIAEAIVCAWPEEPAASRGPACASSAATGAYSISDLPSGVPFAVGATAPRHAPGTYASTSGDPRVRLGDEEERSGIDVVLAHGGVAVRGRVKDALGGVVAGAAIAVWTGEGRAGVSATSDEKGDFTAWVDLGPVRVTARAAGYAAASSYGHAPDHFFELSLVPGSTVVGRVVDRESSAPVVGAHVDAVSLDGGGRHGAESGEDGAFRIDGLAPGRYHVEGVAPGASGYAKAPVLVSVAETSNEVLVELDRSPPVRGRVVEAVTGSPCTGGEISLHDAHKDEHARASIEPNGAVHFIAVLPGTYEVEVACDGHPRREDYPTLTVGASPLDALTWEVDRGMVAGGAVVGPDGTAVANARVTAEPEGGDALTVFAVSDARGQFLLRGLRAGKFTLTASAPGSGADASDDMEISKGKDIAGLRLALGPSATISGTVVDLDRRPAGGVVVIVSGPTSRRVETEDDGSFTATGLTAGGYRLRARFDSARVGFGAGEPAQVALGAGETKRTQLVVARRASFVEGRVVDARGGPLPDFFVEAMAEAGGGSSRHGTAPNRVVSDATGHFRIERIGDGAHTVRAYRPGGAEGTEPHVEAGSTSVTVKVSAGSLTGVVIAPGAPGAATLDRFTIRARDDAVRVSRVETLHHTSGRFALRDLPPGSYTIEIDAPEGTGTATANVTDGASVAIDVTLTARVVVRGIVVWDDSGAPVADAQVSLTTRGEDSRYAGASTVTTKKDGRFEFPHATSGTQVVAVSRADGGEDVTVTLGEDGGAATIRVPRVAHEE